MIISSGDNESHAHPRSDTLGTLGHHGRGVRSLIFSTELSRSAKEFTDRDDTPWYKAVKLEAMAETFSDMLRDTDHPDYRQAAHIHEAVERVARDVELELSEIQFFAANLGCQTTPIQYYRAADLAWKASMH